MLRVDWHRLKGYAPLCFITLGIALWRVTAPFAVILPWIISAMLFCAQYAPESRSTPTEAPRPAGATPRARGWTLPPPLPLESSDRHESLHVLPCSSSYGSGGDD